MGLSCEQGRVIVAGVSSGGHLALMTGILGPSGRLGGPPDATGSGRQELRRRGPACHVPAAWQAGVATSEARERRKGCNAFWKPFVATLWVANPTR